MLGTWIVLGVAVALGAGFFGREISQELRSVRARSWPMNRGCIEWGSVEMVKGTSRNPDYAVGKVSYSYQADDRYYSGEFQKRFMSSAEVHEFVDYLQHKSVWVRFNPRKASTSILRDEDQEERLGL
jgi:hypothetical protein